MRSSLPVLFFAAIWGCADLREDPADREELYDDPVEQVAVQEPVDYAPRVDGAEYGLPREGDPGIFDLIGILPSDGTTVDESSLWVAADDIPTSDQCGGDGPHVSDQLPFVFEGVVSLYPRQYQKVAVCGQDERYYGTFVVEDDTGGIVVLRNSRVATFDVGDRVRLNVRALTFTFGRDADTRAVLNADIEVLDTAPHTSVLYTELHGPLTVDHVGKTYRIEGWVYTPATNDNFNEMVVSSVPPGEQVGALEGDLADCASACQADCEEQCETASVCRTQCPLQCARNNGSLSQAEIPVCWKVSLDVELGRRNAAPPRDAAITVTGPVVNSYGRRIWVNRLGQIEIIATDDATP